MCQGLSISCGRTICSRIAKVAVVTESTDISYYFRAGSFSSAHTAEIALARVKASHGAIFDFHSDSW